MYEADFEVRDYIDPGILLERFLSDCQTFREESVKDDYTFSYVADTIAAIYYYREYNSSDEFIQENLDCLDTERKEWVKYMWRTLDTMSDQQRADVVIESLTQLPVVLSE